MTNLSAYPSLVWAGEMWRRGRGNGKSIAKLEDRITQDVGLRDSDQWAPSCRHSAASELMPQRLAQLGLDPAYVKLARTATYQDLQRVCASCKTWRRCARDLANDDVQIGMRSYCLNAPTIDALNVERSDTPKH